MAAFALALCACSAQAFDIEGRVVSVVDGDTIDVLDAARVVHRVRLSSIDAPESDQPFGQRSRQSLDRMVYRAAVQARCSKMEQRPAGQRNRALCKIYRDGVDINLAQVRAGLAWHYKAYAREQPARERAAYAQAERQARAARRGLWGDAKPMAPWEWRHSGH
jgi:endonuclease YncB( thermonuclease family)